MLVITRRAFRDCGNYTVWKPKEWCTPFFSSGRFGTTINRQAKLLCRLPLGFGLFWSFGREWYE